MQLHLRGNNFASHLIFALELVSVVFAAAIPSDYATNLQQHTSIISPQDTSSSIQFLTRRVETGSSSVSGSTAKKIIARIEFPNSEYPIDAPDTFDATQSYINKAAFELSKEALKALEIKHAEESGVIISYERAGYIDLKPSIKDRKYEFLVDLLKEDGSWLSCKGRVNYKWNYRRDLTKYELLVSGRVHNLETGALIVILIKGKPVAKTETGHHSDGEPANKAKSGKKVHWAPLPSSS